MPDEKTTSAQLCAYWNALVLNQDVREIPLAAARDRVRAVVQTSIAIHPEGVAAMSSPAQFAGSRSIATLAPPLPPRWVISPRAFGRRHLTALATVLVLCMLLGAASLPVLAARPGGQPEGLAILPALTLQDQDNPTVQEITGGDDPLGIASGVAVGADGTLYVIDVPRDQIRVFTADGTPKATWGTSGDGPGEFGFSFDLPWGDLAIAPDGSLYVMDPNLARVQKFTPDGTFLLSFSERGSDEGQILFPFGIGVGPDGHVYVADYQNHLVQVFTGDGTFLAAWNGAEADGPPLAGPADVAVGPDGTVWVTDDILQKVFGFAPDGSVVTAFGKIGALPGEMRGPSGIAVDADGGIYIADRGNDRVQKFAPDGTLLGLVGSHGSGPGQLTQPVSVAIGPDDAVYVTEEGVGRVQKFAADSLEQPIATPKVEPGA